MKFQNSSKGGIGVDGKGGDVISDGWLKIPIFKSLKGKCIFL